MATKTLSPTLVELADALNEARQLTAQPTLSKRDESRVNVLLAQIKALREGAVGSTPKPEVSDLELRWFKALHRNGEVEALHVLNPTLSDGQLRGLEEVRGQMQEGTQTIAYTQALLGGTLVPNEFEKDIILGEAQYDPLLDNTYTKLLRTQGARPLTVPGWDLSTIAAARITESTQQNPFTPPTAAGKTLGGWTYRVSLTVSLELEEDAFEPMLAAIKDAFSIGFARGIGSDLVNGNGTQQPNGLLAGVTATAFTLSFGDSSGVTTTLNDAFQQTYFAVNRAYRNNPSCVWLMNDSVYQWCRTLTDKQGRPLINIQKDREEIMGKPVIVSPSMPGAFHGASPATGGKIVFGDLRHFVVRQSNMTIKRSAERFIDQGLVLYTAHMRADSAVHDPTGGTTPPLISIAVN